MGQGLRSVPGLQWEGSGKLQRESCLEKAVREVSNGWVRGWSRETLDGNGETLQADAAVWAWVGAQRGLLGCNKEPEVRLSRWKIGLDKCW